MIQSLQKKFIRITMVSVFLVLLAIVVAVNVAHITQRVGAIDQVIDQLLENGGDFRPKDNRGFKEFPKEGGIFDRPMHNEMELPYATRFFSAHLDGNYQILSAELKSIASVGEENLSEYVQGMVKDGAQGWYGSFRYKIVPQAEGFLLVAVESTEARTAMFNIALITVVVALLAFSIITLLVVLLSRRAVRPIAQTYEKQKRFITDASHELKTPLTIISANTELLSLTYGENEWCDALSRQTAAMTSLINKMVQMSRLDENSQALTPQPFDFRDAVEDTALSFDALCTARGLMLSADLEEPCPVLSDEGAVRQIVSILMDNAVKYCDPGGTITVTAERHSRLLKSDAVSLTVSNTCAAQLDTSLLFERFYRADNARTSNGSYGLGLSIARSQALRLGGTLSAEKPNSDTIAFTLTIPVK